MGISAFTGPFVIKFVIGNTHEKRLFHIVFWIGSLFQSICLIILFFFNENKFEYIPCVKIKTPDEFEEDFRTRYSVNDLISTK
jgi:hypothetical protein